MTSYELFLSAISNKRAWDCLFLVVCATLLFSSWSCLNSIVVWYGENHTTSSGGWPAVFASVLLGAVGGVLWMAAAALLIAVPAIVVIWASMVVLVTMVLGLAGRPSWRVEVELRKVKREITEFVFMCLLIVGSFVALLSALLAYFVFFNS